MKPKPCWKCGGDKVYCYECDKREIDCECEGVSVMEPCDYCKHEEDKSHE